jgi:hypothetical protein
MTLDTFTPHVGTAFQAETDAGGVELVLADAAGARHEPMPGARPPFTLTFRGPVRPMLPQGTYPLTHPSLGGLDIFLVPIGADAEGVSYEAVFA